MSSFSYIINELNLFSFNKRITKKSMLELRSYFSLSFYAFNCLFLQHIKTNIINIPCRNPFLWSFAFVLLEVLCLFFCFMFLKYDFFQFNSLKEYLLNKYDGIIIKTWYGLKNIKSIVSLIIIKIWRRFSEWQNKILNNKIHTLYVATYNFYYF